MKVWVVGQYRLVNQAFEALVAQLPGVSVVGLAASLVEVSRLFLTKKTAWYYGYHWPEKISIL